MKTNAVCGVCGTNQMSEHGLCENVHDYWVEIADFENPDLLFYIREVVQNLGVSSSVIRKALDLQLSIGETERVIEIETVLKSLWSTVTTSPDYGVVERANESISNLIAEVNSYE